MLAISLALKPAATTPGPARAPAPLKPAGVRPPTAGKETKPSPSRGTLGDTSYLHR